VAGISQVIVLAEDERHQRFVRRYLYRLDLQRVTRFEPLPSGKGCGEQWVRERYADSVRGFRQRHANTALIVVIDADSGDMNRRVSRLENSLTSGKVLPRTAEEKIVHLIPKRNIERWILNLNGRSVNEETDYRHAPEVDDLIDSAAQTLFEWSRTNAPTAAFCVPSLRAAIPEIKRLEFRQ
jgi:hypothetical protein